MSFLYRFAITITRKQPYIDWANSSDNDGLDLTSELADEARTIYLVPESDQRPRLTELLDEYWEDIFEQELAAWMEHEDDWPTPRTRAMFDAWFSAQVTESVFDLVPDQPITELDMEAADLAYVLDHCAWCDIQVDTAAGRFVGFKLANRDRFARREGLVLTVGVDDDRMVTGVVSPTGSAEATAGDDIVFRACGSRCEKVLRSVVPKALRKLMRSS